MEPIVYIMVLLGAATAVHGFMKILEVLEG